MTARRRLDALTSAMRPTLERQAADADADALARIVRADPRIVELESELERRVAAALTVAQAEAHAHGRTLPTEPSAGADRVSRARAEAAVYALAAEADPELLDLYAALQLELVAAERRTVAALSAI